MSRRFVRTTIEPAAPHAALVRARIRESIAAKESLLAGPVADHMARIATLIADSMRNGGKLLIFGNGGSAADATHLAAEFVGRFRYDRAPLPALSLTDNPAAISAIANDFAFEDIFARQIRAFGQPGDVAMGISTSGTSLNVVSGLQTAAELELQTIALTGGRGGALAASADICLRMPTTDTARVQECYLLVGHILCELVEHTLFPVPAP
jgi:D-sedoheptulose 7-phosphate isomerase